MNVNEKKARVISEPMDLELMKACHFRRKGMSPMACGIKRLLDVAGSLAGMILTSPPVIFRQERIGYGGKPFTLYKFRSMSVTSEAGGIPALCQKNDKRLTRTGRFLREHHLDELPQFWNVFKGEMSFVGPRPERKFFAERIKSINPDYELLYQLRPGLFSPATLYNGYTDTMDKMLERLRMDLEYLRNRSLWLDFKIIFLTVSSIISGKKF